MNWNKPAAVPEPLLAARVLDDVVERDVLLTTIFPIWILLVSGARPGRTASNRVDATACFESGAGATPPDLPDRRRLYR